MKPANVIDPDEPVIGETGLPILRLQDFDVSTLRAPTSGVRSWIEQTEESQRVGGWGGHECPLCHQPAACGCEPIDMYLAVGGKVPWRE